MLLPVTLTIAAACAVINFWLAMAVGQRRVAGKVMIGDGGDSRLFAQQRAHANFTEYAPFVLVLIAAIELAGGSATWLWIASAAFVVARIAHPLGMMRPAPNPFRAGGILVTWVVLAGLAGWAATLAYQGTHRAALETVPVEAPRG